MVLDGLTLLMIIGALVVFKFLFPFKYRKHVSHAPRVILNERLKVKVKMVLDGDTIDVWSVGKTLRVRLSAIDCPENGQAWGNKAKTALIRLIGGKNIELETHGSDIHQRLLATVYVKQGDELIDVNEYMVKCGHAWVLRVYYKHLPKSRQRRLNQLQSWAKKKSVGLWKLPNPIPPWKYRKQA